MIVSCNLRTKKEAFKMVDFYPKNWKYIKNNKP